MSWYRKRLVCLTVSCAINADIIGHNAGFSGKGQTIWGILGYIGKLGGFSYKRRDLRSNWGML